MFKKSKDTMNKTKNNHSIFSSVLPIGETGPHRFHLRVLNDEMSVLNIDAKYLIYLNETGTNYLRLFIEGASIEQIEKYFLKHYTTTREEIKEDFTTLIGRVTDIVSGVGVCPIHQMGVNISEISQFEYPLRADFAITYKCNNKCDHCYVGRDASQFSELDLNGVKKLLDALWNIGIPHVALTGGEATLREDLLEIIQYGQNKGFVMGVVTNGRRFSDREFVKKCIKSGLDYVQITLESSDPAIHDKMQCINGAWNETVQAIRNFTQEKIYCMTNTTICRANVGTLESTIHLLHDLGINTFAMNGLIYSGKGKQYVDAIPEEEFQPILEKISSIADELGMRFIWYSPTQYCVVNPIDLGLGAKHCSAANTSVGIEPNGDVIPCQSYFEAVGNILTDDWDKIWNSKLFKRIRNHELCQPKCKKCNLLDVCGGGCPLYFQDQEESKIHAGKICHLSQV
jgi:radical SAM protein with 4Fe4S-binding SPASM domain